MSIPDTCLTNVSALEELIHILGVVCLGALGIDSAFTIDNAELHLPISPTALRAYLIHGLE